MVKKKGKSKRLSLHKKYKILRKVREHKKKERKAEKLNAGKKKKNPGIPNNWPFKEEMLMQAEEARLAELENQKNIKELRRKEKLEAKKKAKLTSDALAKVPEMSAVSVELNAKMELKKAVQVADLVLIVLDARDPIGTRSFSLEDGLIGVGHKKIVLVLNKVDLVPRSVAEKWVQFLRRFHPTIPVKSLSKRATNAKVKAHTKSSHSTQSSIALYEKMQNLNSFRDNGDVEALKAFLSEFGEKYSSKTDGTNLMKVAIVGYPNVGKSSLFNSLKKRNVVEASIKARSTKKCTYSQYNNFLELIDCPALDVNYCDERSVLLRNAIANIYEVDPVPSVNQILSRTEMTNVLQVFKIPLFKSHEDFLAKLAVKKQLIRKGGEPNLLLCARSFFSSLNTNSITFYCLPPNSKSRFEMPAWFKKLNFKLVEEAESSLYNSKMNFSNSLILKSQDSSHKVGDTIEYAVVMGNHIPIQSDDEPSSEDEDNENDCPEVNEKIDNDSEEMKDSSSDSEENSSPNEEEIEVKNKPKGKKNLQQDITEKSVKKANTGAKLKTPKSAAKSKTPKSAAKSRTPKSDEKANDNKNDADESNENSKLNTPTKRKKVSTPVSTKRKSARISSKEESAVKDALIEKEESLKTPTRKKTGDKENDGLDISKPSPRRSTRKRTPPPKSQPKSEKKSSKKKKLEKQ